MRRSLIVLAACLTATACYPRPEYKLLTDDEIAAKVIRVRELLPAKDPNPGPYPKNYKIIVSDYLRFLLRDYDSARIILSEPKQMSTMDHHDSNYAFIAWRVCALINAKNGWGGYTGYKPYALYIKNEKVLWYDDPNWVTPSRACDELSMAR